jgi:hypothetical protein
MGNLSRRPNQPDRAFRGFFRVDDGSQPRRKGGVKVALERLPQLTERRQEAFDKFADIYRTKHCLVRKAAPITAIYRSLRFF